jgi:ankyrin repeat protein
LPGGVADLPRGFHLVSGICGHDAAEAGKVKEVRRLMDSGVDANEVSGTGLTPLHAAAIWGHRDVAELLLSRGGDVNARDGNGMTPLHFAANGDHRNLSVLLIEKGALVNGKALNGWTPLHVAALWGHASVAGILLAHGADVNARGEDAASPLHISTSTSRCHKDVPGLLMKKEGSGDVKFPIGMSPLHAAALNDQKDLVLLLIDKGANVNARTRNGWTASDIAARWGHQDIAALLRSHGAGR